MGTQIMKRSAFYDSIRPRINLTTENVVGFEKHLDYIEANGIPLDKAAYALATSSWETGLRMTPINEGGSERYLRSKKYWPYFGRGLIQVTWRENYIKAARLLGLPENTFIVTPARLLKWQYALPLLFKGMETGLYTGKKLDDYVDGIDESDAEDLREFTNARRIVNVLDRAALIGQRAIVFEHALKDAGWPWKGVVGSPLPPVPPPLTEPAWPGNAVVAEGQSLLIKLGYDPGPIDGRDGPRTEAATEAYQKTIPGLKADGKLGPLTLTQLRISAQEKAAVEAVPPNFIEAFFAFLASLFGKKE